MIDASKKKEKFVNIDQTILQIEKQHGKGSVFLGHNYSSVPILCSTGSIGLDIALGCMGVPQGRIIEAYGPESSGKTTLGLIIMANVQRLGGIGAIVDAEHALDPIWGTKLGVNMNEVLFSQPDNGEQALEILEAYIRSNSVDFIMVDSVAALVPRAELEGEMGDSHMALQARLMSQAMRKLLGAISKSGCSVYFTNQIRSKIGVMFGSPETTTGGNALKFAASIRLDVRKTEADIDKEGEDGQKSIVMKVKVVKNKVATPFKIAHLPLLTGKDNMYGFDNYTEILDLAITNNLITKAGAWLKYGEERFQGKENILIFLRANETIFNDLKNKVINIVVKNNSFEIGSFNDVQSKIEDESLKKRKSRKEKIEDVTSEELLINEKVIDTNIAGEPIGEN